MTLEKLKKLLADGTITQKSTILPLKGVKRSSYYILKHPIDITAPKPRLFGTA